MWKGIRAWDIKGTIIIVVLPVTNHVISHATDKSLNLGEPAEPRGILEGSDEQIDEGVLAKAREALLNLIKSHAFCSVCILVCPKRRGEIDPLGQGWLVYHLSGSSRRQALNDYGPCLISRPCPPSQPFVHCSSVLSLNSATDWIH